MQGLALLSRLAGVVACDTDTFKLNLFGTAEEEHQHQHGGESSAAPPKGKSHVTEVRIDAAHGRANAVSLAKIMADLDVAAPKGGPSSDVWDLLDEV